MSQEAAGTSVAIVNFGRPREGINQWHGDYYTIRLWWLRVTQGDITSEHKAMTLEARCTAMPWVHRQWSIKAIKLESPQIKAQTLPWAGQNNHHALLVLHFLWKSAVTLMYSMRKCVSSAPVASAKITWFYAEFSNTSTVCYWSDKQIVLPQTYNIFWATAVMLGWSGKTTIEGINLESITQRSTQTPSTRQFLFQILSLFGCVQISGMQRVVKQFT